MALKKQSAGMHEIAVGSETIRFELLYSARKRMTIRVHPDARITVDAPNRTEFTHITAFVLKHADWILKKRREFTINPRVAPPRQYTDGEQYRYLGSEYTLEIVRDHIERVRMSNGVLTVGVHDPADGTRIRTLIRRWYVKGAQRIFTDRLAACFPRVAFLGVPEIPPLKMRDMRSRWGSCNSNGTITLNTRLVQAPEQFIDYVILHELCHLREMNHSKAYYALLQRACPNWRTLKKQLNTYTFHAI
jgi:predicted metal-dependent hydrolase